MSISADRRVDAEGTVGVVDVVGVDQTAFPMSKSSSLSD